MRNVDVN